MTLTHLFSALATTAYILMAIQFEERDLVRDHGTACTEYPRRVPMLWPFGHRLSEVSAARRGLTAPRGAPPALDWGRAHGHRHACP